MTVGDRYQPYEMKITDDKVYFAIIGSKKSDSRTIMHNLRELQVSSIDTIDLKVLCRSSRHYGCRIATISGHRSLFFLNFQ